VVWALTFTALTGALAGLADATTLEVVRAVGITVGSLAVATIGALVVSRGNAAVPGWLLLGFSLFWAIGTYSYYLIGLIASDRLDGGLGAGQTLIAIGDIAYVLAIWGLILLFMVVPDGSLPGGRWRVFPWAAGAAIVVWSAQTVWLATTVFDLDSWIARSTLTAFDGASPGPGLWWTTAVLTVITAPVLLLAAWTLIRRYRNSGGETRQQLKWILLGGLTVLLWLALWLPTPRGALWMAAQSLIPGLALATLAATFGLALFKYRLWDVDLVVRRSLVYGTLWLLIAAVYTAVAAGLGLFAGARFPVEVAILLTVVATLVFQPARRRLESLADRWVFGRRHDPVEALHSFGATAAEHPQPRDVATELAEVAATALRLQWVEVEVGDSHPATEGRQRDGISVGSVPIRWGNETWGTLRYQTRPGGQLDPDNFALLETLVAQAALTISHTRLLARMVDAQDAERRRIERDIHDGAQQDLAALIGQLGLAKERADGGAELNATFDLLQTETRRILAGIRDLAQGVYPPVLRDRGLLAAIEDRRAHLPIKLRVNATPNMWALRFDPTVEAAAYFTICEALTNTVKHSGSDSVDITIDGTNESLHIDVTDHGGGFDPKRTWSGTGMTGMSDRIRSVGGELKVESIEGQGTVVRAEIHLTRPRTPQ
jgi:signal transduction histidine kinase